jgi:hypothetical protein
MCMGDSATTRIGYHGISLARLRQEIHAASVGALRCGIRCSSLSEGSEDEKKCGSSKSKGSEE